MACSVPSTNDEVFVNDSDMKRPTSIIVNVPIVI